jgi:hypothetical protein
MVIGTSGSIIKLVALEVIVPSVPVELPSFLKVPVTVVTELVTS